jgi:Family of unknown function (DUF6655)
MRHRALLGAALGCAILSGCIGGFRETTTPRTPAEMLLVSSAAERAVEKFDASGMVGKRVFLDHSRFESIDKTYVLSALRSHLAESNVTLTATAEVGDEGPEIVLELRNAALGIMDEDFSLGTPQLPFSAQGFPPVLLPEFSLFRRTSKKGWAKLELWAYDPATSTYVGESVPLWGTAYYNQWWWFTIGPFDGSNDIYPELIDIDGDSEPVESDGEGE